MTESALRKWEDVRGLVENNIFTNESLDYFIKDLGAPSGHVTYEHFKKFVKSLDSALTDENGTILTPDQYHRAVFLPGQVLDSEEDLD